MPKRRHASVGERLTRMNVVTSSVTLLLACGAFLVYEYFAFRAGMVRSLETHADIIATNVESALLFNDTAAATQTLVALRAEPHIVGIYVVREDRQLFASYVRTGASGVAIPKPLADPDGHRFESDRLVLSHRILSDGAVIGTLYLQADLQEMATRFNRYGGIVAGVLVCSLTIGLLLAMRLQRRITRPILELAAAAKTVSTEKSYSVRVHVGDPDELGMLAGTFNEMLAQIEHRDHELNLAREQLELRVEERTRDLTQEIAERMRLDDQLRHRNQELSTQNRRVQEATRMKSEFLANMSHELRTPLNAIIGFTELLHDGLVSPDSPQHKEFLGDVLTSSHHLLNLINDVLDLAKVEAGKMEFSPEIVDVGALAGEVRDTLRPLAAGKRLRIAIEVDPELGSVFVDRSKLKQVFYNYLSNAIKFSEGGTVVVRAKPEGAQEFRLEVEDTGIGIRAEDIGHLFAEFHQLDSTAAKKYAGTGLGLVLTKRMLEAQGGRCGVSSVVGQGSIFFGILPRTTRAGSVSLAADPAAPAPSDGPTVLVVEDDEDDRVVIERILHDGGYAVETAKTGAQAVARVKERIFDRITLDLLLPDISGWQVLRTIRHDSLNRDTPVVVTTVLPDARIGTSFAIQDFLVKPLRAEELLQSLRRATANNGGAKDILVVDDDPQALALMQTSLKAIGYRSICERDGRAGLAAVATHHPAAIIVDLMMPEMDGFEFLRELRQAPIGKDIPVIVWTAKDLTPHDRTRLQAMAQAVVERGDGSVGQLLHEIQSHASLDPGQGVQR